MKKLICAALLLFATNALATDAYNFKNLGFSADGRYYAFVQSVILDGSGFASAKGQVIYVARNRALEVKQVVLDEEGTEKQAIDQVIAQLNLSRYGINGRQLGQALWTRLPTDLSPATRQAVFSLTYGVDGGAGSVWPKFQLDITELPAPVRPEGCFGGEEAKMIVLSLTNLESHSRRDLQVDNHVPQARVCSWGYQLRHVLSYRGSVAAVLRYETFGFEGPDYTHMIVTGNGVLN